jgi:glutathione synthase/RimK-type ligase-like ATP-grasp enzyme
MCPIESPKENAVYQIVLDNANDNNEYVDIRVPIIGGKIPLVYLKFKTKKNRFTNKAHRATLHTPEELFSTEEIEQIEKYAEAMKVEFCEFDVLRNKGNQKIYIIDVNKTPYGPPDPLNRKDKVIALKKLSDAFMTMV